MLPAERNGTGRVQCTLSTEGIEQNFLLVLLLLLLLLFLACFLTKTLTSAQCVVFGSVCVSVCIFLGAHLKPLLSRGFFTHKAHIKYENTQSGNLIRLVENPLKIRCARRE